MSKPSFLSVTTTVATIKTTRLITLIIGFKAEPAVSLKGFRAVTPTKPDCYVIAFIYRGFTYQFYKPAMLYQVIFVSQKNSEWLNLFFMKTIIIYLYSSFNFRTGNVIFPSLASPRLITSIGRLIVTQAVYAATSTSNCSGE